MKRFRFILMLILAVLFALPAVDAQNFASEAQAQVVEITGNGVRLRTGPGINYSEYTKVNKGKRLTYNYTTGDWYCVNYNGYKVFVSRDFSCLRNTNTSSSSTPKASSNSYNYIKITGDGVRLRKGPGTQYGVYCQLDKGAKVKYIRTEGDWYCVSYNGQILYVSRDHSALSK